MEDCSRMKGCVSQYKTVPLLTPKTSITYLCPAAALLIMGLSVKTRYSWKNSQRNVEVSLQNGISTVDQKEGLALALLIKKAGKWWDLELPPQICLFEVQVGHSTCEEVDYLNSLYPHQGRPYGFHRGDRRVTPHSRCHRTHMVLWGSIYFSPKSFLP